MNSLNLLHRSTRQAGVIVLALELGKQKSTEVTQRVRGNKPGGSWWDLDLSIRLQGS